MILARPIQIVGAFTLAVTVAAGQGKAQPPVPESAPGPCSGCATAAAVAAAAPHWGNSYPGLPSIDLPLGANVYAPLEIQVANAQAASLALYHYDFFEGTASLNPRGRERLHQIACLLPACFAPVVIERTIWTPELDAARRMIVYNELSQAGFPIPVERVVVGVPAPLGWRGIEADIVFHNLLIQTQAGGAGRGTGTSSPTGAGFGAAGGGGYSAPTAH